MPMAVGTYIDELLQVLIQAGKVILPFLVLCDQGLLALEKLLARLLELLALGMFVVDARDHQFMLIGVLVLGELFQELFDGDQR